MGCFISFSFGSIIPTSIHWKTVPSVAEGLVKSSAQRLPPAKLHVAAQQRIWLSSIPVIMSHELTVISIQIFRSSLSGKKNSRILASAVPLIGASNSVYQPPSPLQLEAVVEEVSVLQVPLEEAPLARSLAKSPSSSQKPPRVLAPMSQCCKSENHSYMNIYIYSKYVYMLYIEIYDMYPVYCLSVYGLSIIELCYIRVLTKTNSSDCQALVPLLPPQYHQLFAPRNWQSQPPRSRV